MTPEDLTNLDEARSEVERASSALDAALRRRVELVVALNARHIGYGPIATALGLSRARVAQMVRRHREPPTTAAEGL